jgi:hypothetical protein
MQITKTEITYIHRGAPGNLKTISGNSIVRLDRGFLILKKVHKFHFIE